MKKVIIIGSTGMLGRPVTQEFIKAGYHVSLLTRDKEKARQIFGTDAEIFRGDLKDVNSIVAALKGHDYLYLNLSVLPATGKNDFQPEREGLDNILHAAKMSGIQRIGYLSSLVQSYQGQNGFYWWVFDIKQKAVQKVKSCGIPYTIFYPSTFMESLDQGGYRQGNTIALAGKSRHKMFFIAGKDYARQVVKAYEIATGNQEYIVQGRDGYTADRGAEIFVNHFPGKLKVMKAPLGLLKFLGNFSNKFSYGANIIQALNSYPEKFQGEKTWRELGEPQTSLEQYARDRHP